MKPFAALCFYALGTIELTVRLLVLLALAITVLGIILVGEYLDDDFGILVKPAGYELASKVLA